MAFSGDTLDLQCSLCLCRFHDPIILHCGHTFDRLCIQNFISINESSALRKPHECPLCKAVINPQSAFITDKSLANIIQYVPRFEYFLIDITQSQQKKNVLTFLQRVFNKREIFESDTIIFRTDEERIIFDFNANFDKNFKFKSMSNLNAMLQDAYIYLQKQNGQRKICILTDGLTKHENLTKIDSNIINQRLIIHIGDKNVVRTRQIADEIDFHFQHFNERTLDTYVQHFLKNF